MANPGKVKVGIIGSQFEADIHAQGFKLMPEEAEVVGKVIGVITYLNEPWSYSREATRTGPADWLETDP